MTTRAPGTRTLPLAFLSYAHEDDRHGRITEFRKLLEHEVRVQTGEPFPIFQDRDDIRWGENWQWRIEDALDTTTFLIPIITPSFFRSEACRGELEHFLEREARTARSDLILPVYYVYTPLLSDASGDPLGRAINAHQWVDWRERRFDSYSAPRSARLIAGLARQILDALTTGLTVAQALPRNETSAGPASHALDYASAIHEVPTQTLVVDPLHRGDFAKISAAVDAAKPGARILVRPGYYEEMITLREPLELIGVGERSEIVVHGRNEHALRSWALHGRVRNITFRQSGGKHYSAVHIVQGRLELEDCDVRSDDSSGIMIQGRADPRLRRNRITGWREGVRVHAGGRGLLEDNEILEGNLGVVILKDGNPTVRRNRIHHTGAGIIVVDAGEGLVEENEIHDCDTGINVRDGGSLTVVRNRIYNSLHYAISVHDGGGGTFMDNDLRGNKDLVWRLDADCEPGVERTGNLE